MPSGVNAPSLFPILTPESLLSFQFSCWYPRFSSLSIKSTVIRPLSQEFLEYLDADGVFMPRGAEDIPAESTLSDEEGGSGYESDSEDEEQRKFAFPELDARIREAVLQYGAVFPKLNFSSPRDAAWMLPASSPLKCVSPADVYLLLKSSDFVQHDLSPEHVFNGCPSRPRSYELELILRKWYPVDRSREMRCFVRQEKLLGISQRDPNYYEFWNESSTQRKVVLAIKTFWENSIRGKWSEAGGDYVFDFLLTRDLSHGHVIDFNPYAPRTDPLLFTYEDLHNLLLAWNVNSPQPKLRVIDSPNHPAATRNAPAHQHNMVPLEALTISSGRNIQDFAGALQDDIRHSMHDDSDDD